MKIRLFIIFTILISMSFLALSAEVHALSPEIRFEMLKTKLVEELKAENYTDVLETMEEMKALGVPLPKSFTYFEGKALYKSGNEAQAYTTLESYVETEGKDAKYFSKAIAYMVKAEDAYKREVQRQEQERIAREEERIARERAEEEARIARERAEEEAKIARERAEEEKRIARKRAEEEARIAAERCAQEEALLRQEAEEYSQSNLPYNHPETGLTWTRPVPVRYRDNPFIGKKDLTDRSGARDYCENLSLGGNSDWRIPTLEELRSLVGTDNPWATTDWKKYPYTAIWAADSSAPSGRVFAVDTWSGSLRKEPDTTTARAVCVRTQTEGKLEQFMAERETMFSLDVTGLMWTRPVPINYRQSSHLSESEPKWSRSISSKQQQPSYLGMKGYTDATGAKQFCEDLILGQYSDWRIPTLKEYSTVIAPKKKWSAIDWGEDRYKEVWVTGSPEFSNYDVHFKKDQMYVVDPKKETLATEEYSAGVLCVRTESEDKLKSFFDRLYTIIEHNDKTIMIEDRYMINDDTSYFFDIDLTFKDAEKYCDNLKLAGFTDWRLPTKKDLLEDNVPCSFSEKLYFKRATFVSDSWNYDYIWGVRKVLFLKKPVILDGCFCFLASDVFGGADHKGMVRCVRDIK